MGTIAKQLCLTDSEVEILEECIQSHIHGFYTCAEIGVKPYLDSFVCNVFESVEEFENHPTFFATRRYIALQWETFKKLMTED